ncbi:hypothetical protein B0H17DRAFT_1204701 [Mycena rosella]|uniref:Uncharacterized protein n=1 Tax=Mycena rosella TaxID=1033263 RepID=A0AAD7D8Y9_MYCRO|nr:hypothetical protein B0H17DRAFT_1204701 [Mycena rosella]
MRDRRMVLHQREAAASERCSECDNLRARITQLEEAHDRDLAAKNQQLEKLSHSLAAERDHAKTRERGLLARIVELEKVTDRTTSAQDNDLKTKHAYSEHGRDASQEGPQMLVDQAASAHQNTAEPPGSNVDAESSDVHLSLSEIQRAESEHAGETFQSGGSDFYISSVSATPAAGVSYATQSNSLAGNNIHSRTGRQPPAQAPENGCPERFLVNDLVEQKSTQPRAKRHGPRCKLVDAAHARPASHRSRVAFGDKLPALLGGTDVFEFDLPVDVLQRDDEMELPEVTFLEHNEPVDDRW